MTKVIETPNAPGAVGPYVQGRVHGNTLYTSGCLGLNPSGSDHPTGTVEEGKLALKNMLAVVEAGGFKKEHITKVTVLLKNIADFKAFNEVYEKFFGDHKPCRTCYQVAALPLDKHVEIECIACK